jgi:hypothetical protein
MILSNMFSGPKGLDTSKRVGIQNNHIVAHLHSNQGHVKVSAKKRRKEDPIDPIVKEKLAYPNLPMQSVTPT